MKEGKDDGLSDGVRPSEGSFNANTLRTFRTQPSFFVGSSAAGLSRFVGGQSFRKAEDEEEEKALLNKFQDSSSAPAGDLKPNPEEHASWISRLLFLYVNPLVKLGTTKHLEQHDLWDAVSTDKAKTVHDAYKQHLIATVDPVSAPQGVVWRTLLNKYGNTFAWSGVLKVFHDLIMFTPPFILERLLVHVAQPNANRGVSCALAFAMFLAAIAENLTVNMYFHMLYRMSLHMKVDMIESLYGKSLRITSGVKSDMGVGAIVNLQSNDASKIWNLPMYLHIVWNGPFQIFIVMAMLVRIMGWSATMAGLAVTIVMIPMSTIVGKYLGTARREMVKQTDARVKLSTEIVTGIKAIKLYAWEDAYVERISELREKELAQIRKTQMLSALNSAVFMSGPVLVSLAAFGTFTAMGHHLTASVAFPALALFNLLRFPIIMFPSQIMNLINARVGLQRIQKFLERDEMSGVAANTASRVAVRKGKDNGLDPRAGADVLLGVSQFEQRDDWAVYLQNGNFCWDAGKEPVLRGINVAMRSGQLIMVVGQVGCGKSSLLQALLGEMYQKSGVVTVNGSIAYTSQDPWIQNTTLRSNILMGNAYDDEAYAEVLSACALVPDLEVLPAGDASEIGEKGINLSGGQKHRVALARAAYAAADVYLLDDPLSAVDAHVGRHIFDQCICGLLADSTRILVSHQLQYLPSADMVVVMADGAIVDIGTYEQLLVRGIDLHVLVKDENESGNGNAAAIEAGATPEEVQVNLVSAAAADAGKDGAESADGGPAKPLGPLKPVVEAEAAAMSLSLIKAGTGATLRESNSMSNLRQRSNLSVDDRTRLLKTLSMKEQDGKITKVEERAVGRVQRSVYLAYLRAWSSTFFWVPITVLAMAFSERGLQIGQNVVLSNWANAVFEAMKVGETANTTYFLALYFILGGVSICCQLTRAVLTITGSITASRLLNRRLLAKVVRLPMSFFDSQPTGRLLNRFTKDTEAIDVQVSGVVSMTLTTAVSAMLSALVILIVSPLSIVAVLPLGYVYYRVQSLYIASSRELKRLDSLAFSPIFQHFSETLHGLISIRAFRKQDSFLYKNSFNLDNSNRAWWPAQVVNRWLSVRLEMMGAAIVFSAAFFVTVVTPRNPGLVGLVITAALNLTGIMNWMVRQVTELEVNMNSVERVVEYEKLEEEAVPTIPGHQPPSSWPTEGAIVVRDLMVRYRPELDPVLHGLSFSINGREKVGVCGRTGCGKSTLFMTLYRIVEPCGGSIEIDGVDILRIGLRDLRSRLSLVPQDPVIFSGSVRSNLDPFNQSNSDSAIWEALTQAGMDGFVRDLDKGLDSHIKEGGANVSVGQRQLLCMARALLRNSKILVLDEATSNVDNTTDGLIQRTIRTAFRNCTVLTIAHRLHTIIDSDRILLLDAGRLQEFGSPQELLKQPTSAFRKLVEESTRGGGMSSDTVARALGDARVGEQ